MAQDNTVQIIAPSLLQQDWSESSVLGAITWLWLRSSKHQQYPLHTFGQHVLPALNHRQFALFTRQDQPIGYVSWAWFDEAAEQAYIESNRSLLVHPERWHSGHRLWIIDWFALLGHSRQIKRLLQTHLMPNEIACALYHKGEQTGLRINIFAGEAISPEELAYWRRHHELPCIRQTTSKI